MIIEKRVEKMEFHQFVASIYKVKERVEVINAETLTGYAVKMKTDKPKPCTSKTILAMQFAISHVMIPHQAVKFS